jgi:hypothetical protein
MRARAGSDTRLACQMVWPDSCYTSNIHGVKPPLSGNSTASGVAEGKFCIQHF